MIDKMVMIVYNEALDEEVMEGLNCNQDKNYTKITGVFGKGASSGTHLGTDVWPGRNNILYIACQEEEVRHILFHIRELRKKIGKEGIKAFVLPLEDLT